MITKEAILKKTNGGLNVYKWVLEQNGISIKQRGNRIENTYNPFYNDSKPSLSIYFDEERNEWCFKDYGNSGDGKEYYGDFIDFTSCHYGIGLDKYNVLLEKIDADLKGYEPSTTFNYNSVKCSTKKKSEKFELVTDEYPN